MKRRKTMKPTKNLLWKIEASHKVIRSGIKKYGPNIAVAWTGGKDSTVLLDLVRSLHEESLPIPALYIDTGLDFEEVVKFIEDVSRLWNVKVLRVTDKPGLRRFNREKNKAKRKELARLMKIRGINKEIKKNNLDALLVGI